MHLHGLRHTFASLKLMQGLTLKEVQELLGRSEQRVVGIFSHLTDDRLAEISALNQRPIDVGVDGK